MATALKRYNGGRVLVFVVGAFAEMSEDVNRICDIIAHTAHRGWARLLLNRARDLIIHDPAHHGANGAAMPTDEGDQDGHFFFNHPERGDYPAASNSN